MIEQMFATTCTAPHAAFLDIPPDPDPEWLAEIAGMEAAAEAEPVQDVHPALADLPANEFLWARLVDTRPRTGAERLQRLEALARLKAAVNGWELREMAEALDAWRAEAEPSGCSPADVFDSAAAEIALVTKVATSTARARLTHADQFAHRLPATLAAMEAGRIGAGAAWAIREETAALSAAECAEVEKRVAPAAAARTPRQVREQARTAVIATNPAAARKRAHRARAERNVTVQPAGDDMARLSAYLPADDARCAYDVLTALGRAAKTPDDARGVGARIADTLVDLILNSGGSRPQVTVEAHVVVGAGTLLGLDDRPAELAGHGPITAELARALAEDAVWSRILTDPATGEVIEYGTSRYRPSRKQARRVRARDRICRFPGCRRPAWTADIDHTIARADGGGTDDPNLGCFCRHHHRIKHLPGWQVDQGDRGRITVISPHGITQTTRPEPLPGMPEPEPEGAAG
jgi:hypothetical protein